MAACVLGRSGWGRRSMENVSPSLEQMLAGLKSLATTSFGSGAEQKLRPVDSWHPAHCGDIGLEIRRDGTWAQEGVRITRESLVKLFASILRKDEDGETYLITPVEKVRVRVEDAPFLAVRADRVGEGREQTIAFTTNVGDVVVADAAHPIRVVTSAAGEPRPYVLVRGRLEARILRAPFLELAEWSEERDGAMGVWSSDTWFSLGARA
ncbi:MAG TPA: DUF1285 domain-containing protein [Caulobacterales bacterium]|nr:DUF1285 domain-containing protein [Caulobacterales bacterium]